MKLLFIRHGDPDYVHDSLTEKGKREASALADFFKNEKLDAVYASPLGRAKETCLFVQRQNPFSFRELPWLKEFDATIRLPYLEKATYCWDLLPSYMAEHPFLFDPKHWMEDETFIGSNLPEKWNAVRDGFYQLLFQHGYKREKGFFRTINANRDTVVFFCHFGITAVLMALLTETSPYLFWQHFCSLPTSVTTFVTEERQAGIASFRCLGFGDLSHLNLSGETPSFSARFCETFDSDEKH